jgi:5-deoxy-glucuronate isomerase
MARLIRSHDNDNRTIVDSGDDTLSLITFQLVQLAAGETLEIDGDGFEHCIVPMSGLVDVAAGGIVFTEVGGRESVFAGNADSVYVPARTEFSLAAVSAAEVAVAGACVDGASRMTPFRIPPDQIEEVDVGSIETHSHRRIRHILGQRQNGHVERLLVSELYTDPGCWSGYPPHKHDTDDGIEETDHEELYHYRFDPPSGFGTQSCYSDGEAPTVHLTRDGDTFCLDRGYHPTSTSPGHRGYIFTILAGRSKRGLIQRFEKQHEHLMREIPGIQSMREAFK